MTLKLDFQHRARLAPTNRDPVSRQRVRLILEKMGVPIDATPCEAGMTAEIRSWTRIDGLEAVGFGRIFDEEVRSRREIDLPALVKERKDGAETAATDRVVSLMKRRQEAK